MGKPLDDLFDELKKLTGDKSADKDAISKIRVYEASLDDEEIEELPSKDADKILKKLKSFIEENAKEEEEEKYDIEEGALGIKSFDEMVKESQELARHFIDKKRGGHNNIGAMLFLLSYAVVDSSDRALMLESIIDLLGKFIKDSLKKE